MENQRTGVLMAALLGDALGTPFNGLKQGHVVQLTGGPVEGFLEDGALQPEKPDRNHIPGLHSILGQRLLAAAIMDHEDALMRGPVARVGAHLFDLAGNDPGSDQKDFGALRGPGRPLRRSIERWRDTYPWEETDYVTEDGDSEGVGVVVPAIAPVCLGQDDASGIAIRIARQTHFRLIALAGAAAVARLYTRLLDGGSYTKIDGPEIIKPLVEEVREIEDRLIAEHKRDWREVGWGLPPARLSDALAPLSSLLQEKSDDLAEKTIVKTAGECSPNLKVTHVQHGFIPAALCWSIYRGLGPLPAVRAVEDILIRGGECSAVASLVVSMMVARHGPDCIPDEWWDGLLAKSVVERLLSSRDEDAVSAWLQSEREWTGQEQAFQQQLRDAQEKQRLHDIAKGKNPTKSKPKKTRTDKELQELPFAPPPNLWLNPGDEEDPRVKKKLKAARGKRKIDWKEERRKAERAKGNEED